MPNLNYYGYSIRDDFNISSLRNRTSALESNASTLGGNAVVLTDRVSTLESGKLNISDYQQYQGEVDARFTTIEGNVSNIRSTLDGNVDQLYTEINNVVTSSITNTISELTYEQIADSLLDPNSPLAAALATKVVSTVQSGVDMLQDELINARLLSSSYNADKEVLNQTLSSINDNITNINNTLLSDISSLSTAVSERVTIAEYTTNNANIQDELDTKLAITTYSDDQNALENTLNNLTTAIAGKVSQAIYDSKVLDLSTRDYTWEKRILSVEEYILTMGLTYNIVKPDGELYTYSAQPQELSQIYTLFSLASISFGNGTIRLSIQLTDYSYNILIGNITAVTSQGNVSITKEDFNSNNLIGVIQISPLTTFPFTIEYRDTNNVALYSFEVTKDIYESLITTYTIQPEYVIGETINGWGIDTSKKNEWQNLQILSPFNTGSPADTDGDLLENEQMGGSDLANQTSIVSGKAVLIQRGVINFGIKASNAQAAGAKMVIIYNSNMTGGNTGDILFGVIGLSSVTIPVVVINNITGQDLLVKIRNGEKLYTNLFYDNADNNLLSITNKVTTIPITPNPFTNLVPSTFPNGNQLYALNFYAKRKFYFTFTPTTTTVNVFLKYSSSAYFNQIISRVYDSSDTVNYLENVINVNTDSADLNNNNQIIFVRNNGVTAAPYVNNTSVPDFTIPDLTIGTTYTIEVLSIFNGTDYTRMAFGDLDVGIKIIGQGTTTILPITYINTIIDNSVVSGSEYIIDNFNSYSEYPELVWTRNDAQQEAVIITDYIDTTNPNVTSKVP